VRNKTEISIIIVNYKSKNELFNCIESIRNCKTKATYEILVIDNDERPTVNNNLSLKFKGVRYIKTAKNLGYGAGNNYGARLAKGEFLFILNPDTVVLNDTIDGLLRLLKKDKKTGIVAPLLIDEDKKIYPLQGTLELTPVRAIFGLSFINKIFPNNFIAKKYWLLNWDKAKDKEVDVVPGTAFMIRKKLFEQVGGFDENFFLYFEEFDLCRRIKKLGLKLKIVASSKLVHLWGKSTKQRNDIKKVFSKSRFYYFRKNFGLLNAYIVELFSGISKNSLILFFILMLGAFLRFYKLDQLMIFIGDQGWFYLSAKEMLLTGNVPLVGIPSSVVWLKQGPLATYLIALALAVGRYNPVSPAVLFSLLDILTVYFVYLIGKKFINPTVGLFAAAFYTTSPLVVIMSRMPYHTSVIPLISTVFFLCLFYIGKQSKKLYFLLFFFLGLLIQLELSNSIVLILTIAYFYFNKIKINKPNLLRSIIGLIAGVLPFIVYDLTHKFTQTLGLPLWALNRIRLFLGLTTSGNSTASNLPQALLTIKTQLAEIIYPNSEIILWIAIVSCLLGFGLTIRKRMTKGLLIILFWLLIPIIGFLVHASPGMAYFALLFPVLAIIIGTGFGYFYSKRNYIFLPIFLFFIFANSSSLFSNNYYISTASVRRVMPQNYSFDPTWVVMDDVAKQIAKDAGLRYFQVLGGGFLSKYSSGIDNFKYLIWYHGGKYIAKNNLKYYILLKDEKNFNKNNKSIFYKNDYYIIYKEG
jgi:GT2 family glycosyltransferase